MPVNCISRGDILFMLQGALFIALLLVASVFDIKKRIIPDRISIAIALTGLICFEPVRLLGCLSALPLLLAALICGGMGGGDIKLMAASGIILGIEAGIAATIIGLTAMLIFYAAYAVIQGLRRKGRKRAFPLAPFLSVGCIAAYFINIGGIGL